MGAQTWPALHTEGTLAEEPPAAQAGRPQVLLAVGTANVLPGPGAEQGDLTVDDVLDWLHSRQRHPLQSVACIRAVHDQLQLTPLCGAAASAPA